MKTGRRRKRLFIARQRLNSRTPTVSRRLSLSLRQGGWTSSESIQITTRVTSSLWLSIAISSSPQASERCRKVSLRALDLGEEDTFALDKIDRGQRKWSNYGRMERVGHRLQGMEALIWDDLPVKAGLSSSAALEVAYTPSSGCLASRSALST